MTHKMKCRIVGLTIVFIIPICTGVILGLNIPLFQLIKVECRK